MPIEHIKPVKGSEIVKRQILRQIESGEWPCGSRLPSVTDLAALFQVGRSTIREALSALQATGWVDIRHGGGTFVNPAAHRQTANEDQPDFFANVATLREVIEVRKFIEAGCASLAAQRRTEADMQRLEEILRRMDEALGNEQLSERADVDFHLQIAQASHNQLFAEMMHSLTQRLQDSMQESRRAWFFAEKASAGQLLDEHRGIVEAIRERNEAMAAERMMRHIAKVDAVLREYLK